MAGSMKDIKLRIKSVESTMQITKAMELVASSKICLLYTSPSPRDRSLSRMPSSA